MSTAAPTLPMDRRSFAARHQGDRAFFVAFLLFIWTAVLMGFGPGALKHFGGSGPSKPAYLHLHAIAFFGWLVLLTVQFALIQVRQVRIHRLLGVGGAGLAAMMVLIGAWTAIAGVPARIERGSNAGFLAVQLMDLVLFASLVAAALILRRNPASHRRLILIATLQLSGAGFGRWIGQRLGQTFSDLGFLGGWLSLYGPIGVGLVALGIYDLATRGRLHPIFVPAVAWVLAGHIAALLLVKNAAWIAFVTQAAGR